MQVGAVKEFYRDSGEPQSDDSGNEKVQADNPVLNAKSEPDPVNDKRAEDPTPKKKYYEVPW